MAIYDYKSGKQRILDIIANELEVVKEDKLPGEENLTFTNAYESWITSVFVDIRDSTTLFTETDKRKVSRVIRSFTSEAIEILRKEDSLREIGIRGDCVYAIYTTEFQSKIYDIVDLGFYLNTFMAMLNKLLTQKSLPNIRVGIGISTAKELVIKAGRKATGINSKVWIGDAVTKASNLSAVGGKNGYDSLVLSDLTHSNVIDTLVKNSGEGARSWFKSHFDSNLGTFHEGTVVKLEFNEWIANGMPD